MLRCYVWVEGFYFFVIYKGFYLKRKYVSWCKGLLYYFFWLIIDIVIEFRSL